MTALTIDQRRALCETATATLNDRPAHISGYRNDFAFVHHPNGLGAQWSWETVAHVLANGGRFYT